jgi:tetratricopeptide (TPR) repeat protein
MLFLAHPVHTEVVSNIKSGDEILCFMFMILSLLTLYQFTIKRKRILFVISILAYTLSFLSKESALTFLAVAPLFLYCFSKEKLKNIFLMTLPFVAVAIALLFLRSVIVQKGLPNIDPLYNSLLAIPTISHRLSTAILIIGKYFRLLIFPHPLVWDYSYNQVPETGWLNPYVILTVVLSAALLIYAVLKLKERNIFSFGILFYFITLSVTANIVFYIGSTMAERFLYMPSLGFCIVLFFLLKNILKADSDYKSLKTILLYSIIIFILTGYSYKTIDRSQDWKNNFTLFMAGVHDSPNSAKTHMSLAGELNNYAKLSEDTVVSSQLYQKAIEEYYKGLDIYPHNAEGWATLGVTYLNYKKLDSSQAAFERAIAVDSCYVRAYNNIGAIQAFKGDYRRAISYFEKAVALDSTYADAYGNIAGCYNNLGDYKQASIYYEKALKINPDNEGIKRNLMLNNNMLIGKGN